jgi:integrase
MFFFAMQTGYRASECTNLRVKHVSSDGKTVNSIVSVPRELMKGGKKIKNRAKARSLPLTERLRELLRPMILDRDPEDFVFRSSYVDKDKTKAPRPIGIHWLWKLIKRAAKAAKIDTTYISCHSTRKTFCEIMHKLLGEKIELTQEAMGHKNLDSTRRYLAKNTPLVHAKIQEQTDFSMMPPLEMMSLEEEKK